MAEFQRKIFTLSVLFRSFGLLCWFVLLFANTALASAPAAHGSDDLDKALANFDPEIVAGFYRLARFTDGSNLEEVIHKLPSERLMDPRVAFIVDPRTATAKQLEFDFWFWREFQRPIRKVEESYIPRLRYVTDPSNRSLGVGFYHPDGHAITLEELFLAYQALQVHGFSEMAAYWPGSGYSLRFWLAMESTIINDLFFKVRYAINEVLARADATTVTLYKRWERGDRQHTKRYQGIEGFVDFHIDTLREAIDLTIEVRSEALWLATQDSLEIPPAKSSLPWSLALEPAAEPPMFARFDALAQPRGADARASSLRWDATPLLRVRYAQALRDVARYRHHYPKLYALARLALAPNPEQPDTFLIDTQRYITDRHYRYLVSQAFPSGAEQLERDLERKSKRLQQLSKDVWEMIRDVAEAKSDAQGLQRLSEQLPESLAILQEVYPEHQVDVEAWATSKRLQHYRQIWGYLRHGHPMGRNSRFWAAPDPSYRGAMLRVRAEAEHKLKPFLHYKVLDMQAVPIFEFLRAPDKALAGVDEPLAPSREDADEFDNLFETVNYYTPAQLQQIGNILERGHEATQQILNVGTELLTLASFGSWGMAFKLGRSFFFPATELALAEKIALRFLGGLVIGQTALMTTSLIRSMHQGQLVLPNQAQWLLVSAASGLTFGLGAGLSKGLSPLMGERLGHTLGLATANFGVSVSLGSEPAVAAIQSILLGLAVAGYQAAWSVGPLIHSPRLATATVFGLESAISGAWHAAEHKLVPGGYVDMLGFTHSSASHAGAMSMATLAPINAVGARLAIPRARSNTSTRPTSSPKELARRFDLQALELEATAAALFGDKPTTIRSGLQVRAANARRTNANSVYGDRNADGSYVSTYQPEAPSWGSSRGTPGHRPNPGGSGTATLEQQQSSPAANRQRQTSSHQTNTSARNQSTQSNLQTNPENVPTTSTPEMPTLTPLLIPTLVPEMIPAASDVQPMLPSITPLTALAAPDQEAPIGPPFQPSLDEMPVLPHIDATPSDETVDQEPAIIVPEYPDGSVMPPIVIDVPESVPPFPAMEPLPNQDEDPNEHLDSTIKASDEDSEDEPWADDWTDDDEPPTTDSDAPGEEDLADLEAAKEGGLDAVMDYLNNDTDFWNRLGRPGNLREMQRAMRNMTPEEPSVDGPAADFKETLEALYASEVDPAVPSRLNGDALKWHELGRPKTVEAMETALTARSLAGETNFELKLQQVIEFLKSKDPQQIKQLLKQALEILTGFKQDGRYPGTIRTQFAGQMERHHLLGDRELEHSFVAQSVEGLEYFIRRTLLVMELDGLGVYTGDLDPKARGKVTGKRADPYRFLRKGSFSVEEAERRLRELPDVEIGELIFHEANHSTTFKAEDRDGVVLEVYAVPEDSDLGELEATYLQYLLALERKLIYDTLELFGLTGLPPERRVVMTENGPAFLRNAIEFKYLLILGENVRFTIYQGEGETASWTKTAKIHYEHEKIEAPRLQFDGTIKEVLAHEDDLMRTLFGSCPISSGLDELIQAMEQHGFHLMDSSRYFRKFLGDAAFGMTSTGELRLFDPYIVLSGEGQQVTDLKRFREWQGRR